VPSLRQLRGLRSPTSRTIPLHFFKDKSIAAFQQTIRELFLGAENREITKRYLKRYIDRIGINLSRVEIMGKTEAIVATLENRTAVKTPRDGVLTAVDSWLPGTDSCRRFGEHQRIQNTQFRAACRVDWAMRPKEESIRIAIITFGLWGVRVDSQNKSLTCGIRRELLRVA
jgi:hypothetical protein